MKYILTAIGLILILGIIFWLVDLIFGLSVVGWERLKHRIFRVK